MPSWRYIAQRATTGEFLDLELPLERDELAWSLSGAGALRGTVEPDVGRMRATDGRLLLEEWGTFIYAEADGEIRWGGIVVDSGFSGEKWTVEAAGFATYPHGMAWDDVIRELDTDAFLVIRQIWLRLQAKPDGNLGVTVHFNGSKPPFLGKIAVRKFNPDGSLMIVDGAVQMTEPELYEFVAEDTPDCGAEIDKLAKAAPLDYVESHRWIGDSMNIEHRIDLHYPRVGTVRTDIAFVQGSNIVELITPEIQGDDFANEVVALGAGEGAAALRAVAGVRDGRLRRTAVYTDKSVTDQARLDALARDDLSWRQRLLTISEITVRDHPNAPIGSWQLGDDILVDGDVPWIGRFQLWCRVVGWSLLTEDTASIQLIRSDGAYGG